MKRITTILLIAILAFALCSCGPGKDDGKPSAEAKQLWKMLDGVWMRADGENSFITFSSEGDILYCSYGQFMSDFFEGGKVTVTFIEGVKCTYDVEAASFGGEPVPGAFPVSKVSFTLDAGKLSGGLISVTDNATDGAKHDFKYVGADMNDIDPEELLYPERTAWAELTGCWCCKEDDTYFFVEFGFGENDGEPYFFTGIPFSGYGMSSRITGFLDDKSGQQYIVELFFQGYENDEGSMPDYSTTANIRYDRLPAGILKMSNVAGSGSIREFRFMCDSLYDLDMEEMWTVLG